ncbi:hypothetical protein ACHAWF_010229 [Thalassiosira exigua]
MCKPTKFQDSIRTQPESFSDNEEEDEAIVYTEEEIDAMRQVRAKLVEEHGIEESRVGSLFLAVTTVVGKLRVDETADKIVKLLGLMEELGCPDGIDDELWKPTAAHELENYAAVGKDLEGCQTIWVKGKKTPEEEERNHCHACIMNYLAGYADPKTLRNGHSFFIDLSVRNDDAANVGNEQKLQSFYQAIPGRPRAIVLAGAGFFLRTVVQASINVASLFIKQKILERIHFVTLDDAKAMLPSESVPTYAGGEGGGIEDQGEWVKRRLERLPVPAL